MPANGFLIWPPQECRGDREGRESVRVFRFVYPVRFEPQKLPKPALSLKAMVFQCPRRKLQNAVPLPVRLRQDVPSQEFESEGKAAEEIRALWKWIKEQLNNG